MVHGQLTVKGDCWLRATYGSRFMIKQDELWLKKYEDVISFIQTNHRNPSKHDDEERGKFLNWIRHKRKLFNAGLRKEYPKMKLKIKSKNMDYANRM